MKAIVYETYGPPEVLHLNEMETPVPEDNEVLVKVQAVSVTLYDCWLRKGTGPAGFGLISRIASGFRRPKQPILGTELAGEVEAVGKDVTRFKQGDAVYGFSGTMGAYAQYKCFPEDGMLAPMPTNMNFEEAGSVPYGALTAYFFLRHANIQPGQKVLVFGASGGVGNYAVQLAKHHFGAEVTGVCSGAKMDMVKSLGADKVIDYSKEDFTKGSETYDVIFDTISKSPFAGSKRVLKEGGYYLHATFGLLRLLQLVGLKLTSNKETGPMAELEQRPEDLDLLKQLIEDGKLKSVVDRSFPMAQAADAHRYAETGQKVGNVVITMTQ